MFVNPVPVQIQIHSFVAVAVLLSSTVTAMPTLASGDQQPAAPANVVPLLERTEVRDNVGQYALSYLTGDGIAVAEQGALKPTADGTGSVLVKQGSYAYVGDDGRTYTVHYVADENGYRAYGDHLPVAPVVPELQQ